MCHSVDDSIDWSEEREADADDEPPVVDIEEPAIGEHEIEEPELDEPKLGQVELDD